MQQFMSLSSVVLMTLLSTLPCFAWAAVPLVSNQSPASPQSTDVLTADLFRTLERVLDTVDRERQRQAEQEQRQEAERQRQEREAAREQQRREQEAARQEAARQQTSRGATGQAQPQRPAARQGTNTTEPVAIYSAQNPRSCNLERNNQVADTCKSFQLVQIDGLYYFSFIFENSAITFISSPDLETNRNDTGYSSTRLYLSPFTYFGTEQQVNEAGSRCAVGILGNEQYTIRCTANNLALEYSGFREQGRIP